MHRVAVIGALGWYEHFGNAHWLAPGPQRSLTVAAAFVGPCDDVRLGLPFHIARLIGGDFSDHTW